MGICPGLERMYIIMCENCKKEPRYDGKDDLNKKLEEVVATPQEGKTEEHPDELVCNADFPEGCR